MSRDGWITTIAMVANSVVYFALVKVIGDYFIHKEAYVLISLVSN